MALQGIVKHRFLRDNIARMDTLTSLKRVLRDTLMLGDRVEQFTRDTRLLGGLPEFDSMAVVSLLTAIEEEYGVAVSDDELSAEVFATVGSVEQFVNSKLGE